MHAHCLLRLSRAGIANVQQLFSNSTLPPGRSRFPPDAWHSLLQHEQQYAMNPHLEVVPPAPRAVATLQDTNWRGKIVDMRDFADIPSDDAFVGQPRGSFRAQAPSASIGVAEMAAALALASFTSVHPPAVASYTKFPPSIQSPLHSVSFPLLEEAFGEALLVHTTPRCFCYAPPVPAVPRSTTPGYSPASEPPTDTATVVLANTSGSLADSDSGPGLGHVPMTTTLTASTSSTSDDEVHLTAVTAAAGIPLAATAADYLPASLQPLVTPSVKEYWQGVSEAALGNRLHATIYVSPKAWPHVAPTITAMVGADGHGPAGRVRFALVPLGNDYVVRANAAQNEQSDGSRGGGAAAAAAASMEDMAARFGLDVALAGCVTGPDGHGVKRLDVCPAMVIRGGYMDSTRSSGGVCPAWSMRQELDAHVRRNLMYNQSLL
ncbi:hypothetical protein VaNZ11_011642 [Volvox africanus]|uniref:Uncharacterized protein n=1 Tax=Volvox africanus TaxID=51714 RepID=A0ABQ5SCT1_9CHLO|nr:hypothetical protein VaNZ11_011642 [Volvox africanus]